MAFKESREYRTFNIETRAKEDKEEESYVVRGYASTFEPYVLFSQDDIDYSEQIAPEAFDEADMSDVIFLYNHEGMVYARQKNGTLKCSVDKHGLLIEADLGSTEESRKLYEAIDSGLIDQMSFAFTVDSDEYNSKTHTRIIHRIGKVYDVSAVSIPANPGTDISTKTTRDYFNGVIEAEKAERLERERVLELEKRKLLILGGMD